MDQKINSSLPSEGQGPAYALNEAVESLEDYGPGGYHPIHLGDTFSAGRYEVICKLGYGSYSTVWLCRDKTEQRYVAVKVTISDDGSVERRNQHESKILLALRNGNLIHPGRRFVIISLDEFTIQGPNGRHQCFVFPVALNSVGTAKRASTRDDSMFPAQIARSIATQAILALSYIHSCGLIHSDLHTGNLLIQAPSSNSWPLSKPYEQIRDQEQLPVHRWDGLPIGSNVPRYQVQHTGLFTPSDKVAHDCQIFITDFGEAHIKQASDKAYQRIDLNTPLLVRPFETLFGYPVTSASDIWTIGLTLFDLLGRSHLFECFWPTEDLVLVQAIGTLGSLPAKWWQAWPNRSKFFKKDGSYQEDLGPAISHFPTPLAEKIRRCIGREAHCATYGFSEPEMQSLEALLRSMLQYEPKDRITAEEALRSEWVQTYGIPALTEAIPDIDLSSLGLS